MERYNVNGTEEEQLKQKELAALSIARCKEERQRLRDCFRSSIFGWCSKEQSEFWDCFTEVGGACVKNGGAVFLLFECGITSTL